MIRHHSRCTIEDVIRIIREEHAKVMRHDGPKEPDLVKIMGDK